MPIEAWTTPATVSPFAFPPDGNEPAGGSVLRQGVDGHGECWVAIAGELDVPVSERLREQLEALLGEGCRRLTVDLRQTVVIEASGLRVLVEALRELEERGGALVLHTPPGQVYELGRVRRLGELLATVEEAIDEAEAIRRLDRLVS